MVASNAITRALNDLEGKHSYLVRECYSEPRNFKFNLVALQREDEAFFGVRRVTELRGSRT